MGIKMIGDKKEAELTTVFYHKHEFNNNNSIIFTVDRLVSKKTSLIATNREELFYIFTIKTKGHWKISKTVEDLFETVFIKKFKSDSEAVVHSLKYKDKVEEQYDVIAKDILEKEK